MPAKGALAHKLPVYEFRFSLWNSFHEFRFQLINISMRWRLVRFLPDYVLNIPNIPFSSLALNSAVRILHLFSNCSAVLKSSPVSAGYGIGNQVCMFCFVFSKWLKIGGKNTLCFDGNIRFFSLSWLLWRRQAFLETRCRLFWRRVVMHRQHSLHVMHRQHSLQMSCTDNILCTMSQWKSQWTPFFLFLLIYNYRHSNWDKNSVNRT